MGTSLALYKIEVTEELVTSVGGGVYPETSIILYAHSPALPRPDRRWSEGMKPLNNRRIILSCHEAFKNFVNYSSEKCASEASSNLAQQVVIQKI